MTSSPEGGAQEDAPLTAAAGAGAVADACCVQHFGLAGGAAGPAAASKQSPTSTAAPLPPSTAAAGGEVGVAMRYQAVTAESAQLPVVPVPAEQLARTASVQDPSLPEHQLAAAATAAAAAAAAARAAPGGGSSCGATPAPTLGVSPETDCPDAAGAAAKAEVALGVVGGGGTIPPLTASEAARHALVASWARVATTTSGSAWQQQPCMDCGPGQPPAAAAGGADASPSASAAVPTGSEYAFLQQQQDQPLGAPHNVLGGGGRGQWHRTIVHEAEPQADYVLVGLPYAQEGERRHHLLKHELPDEARGMNALRLFGVDNVRQAVRRINKMAQRELQEMFQRVYGVRSSSNNNLWLRKKLVEAVNTRPRGALERMPRPQPPPSPAGGSGGAGAGPLCSASLPAHAVGAAAAAGGDPSRRRRRKKSSAPVRASDGLKANPNNAADALLALLGRADEPGVSEDYYESDSGGSEDHGSTAAPPTATLNRATSSSAAKRAKLDAAAQPRPRTQRSAAVSAVAAAAKAVLLDTPMEVDTTPGFSAGGGGRWGRGRRGGQGRNYAVHQQQQQQQQAAVSKLGGFGGAAQQQQYGGYGERQGWAQQAAQFGSVLPPPLMPPPPIWQQGPPPALPPGLAAVAGDLTPSQAELLCMLVQQQQQQQPGGAAVAAALGALGGFALPHPDPVPAYGYPPTGGSPSFMGGGAPSGRRSTGNVVTDLLGMLLQQQQPGGAAAAVAAPAPVSTAAARDLLTHLLGRRQQNAEAPPEQRISQNAATGGLHAFLHGGRPAAQQAQVQGPPPVGSDSLERLLQDPLLARLRQQYYELRWREQQAAAAQHQNEEQPRKQEKEKEEEAASTSKGGGDERRDAQPVEAAPMEVAADATPAAPTGQRGQGKEEPAEQQQQAAKEKLASAAAGQEGGAVAGASALSGTLQQGLKAMMQGSPDLGHGLRRLLIQQQQQQAMAQPLLPHPVFSTATATPNQLHTVMLAGLLQQQQCMAAAAAAARQQDGTSGGQGHGNELLAQLLQRVATSGYAGAH